MFLSQSKASGVKMKTTLKNLCLTSVAVCAIGIAGLAITSESPEAQADTQIPGYTKHCPIYFFGALGGNSDRLWCSMKRTMKTTPLPG